MELKPLNRNLASVRASLNCTVMELKPKRFIIFNTYYYCLNCTVMELKHYSNLIEQGRMTVLIVPLWN